MIRGDRESRSPRHIHLHPPERHPLKVRMLRCWANADGARQVDSIQDLDDKLAADFFALGHAVEHVEPTIALTLAVTPAPAEIVTAPVAQVVTAPVAEPIAAPAL
jgi:hypothetical protein